MPEPAYVAAAIATAAAITFALRLLPFLVRGALRDSPLVADLGRWMPLGAVVVLAVSCLAAIDVTAPGYGAGQLAGVATTLAAHLWRRNAVLSIVAGTGVCVLVSTLW